MKGRTWAPVSVPSPLLAEVDRKSLCGPLESVVESIVIRPPDVGTGLNVGPFTRKRRGSAIQTARLNTAGSLAAEGVAEW